MNKQQIILVTGGIALFSIIFFFGRTIPPKKNTSPATTLPGSAININSILAGSRSELTPSQQAYLAQLETAVVRGDVKDQQIKVYRQIADFWKDSAHMLLPYAYYSAEAAKLENSQKSLTFAAQFFLNGVRQQDNPDMKKWMALQAKDLFDKALELDPGNDSLKVGLGSCYLFGGISENPMQGISMIREVADRNPDNAYAQFMLGLGGMVSGQFDKAIERFTKVVENDPDNLEAILLLAEASERTGQKEEAVKWYKMSQDKVSDPDILQEIQQRIKLLQQ